MGISSPAPVILWFRQDLRLADNPALQAAVASGRPVLPVYIHDDAPGRWRAGAASRWWLHHSLERLAAELARRGTQLVLRRGPAAEVLDRLLAETGAAEMHWNRLHEPWAVARDTAIKAKLRRRGIAAHSHNAALLAEPWELATGAGAPYKVFSPFWRSLRARRVPPPARAAPARIGAPSNMPASDELESWRLLPRPDWAAGLRATWTPGEMGAVDRLNAFLDGALPRYAGDRDRPDLSGTARLSPHLHWGEIGPRQVWHAVSMRAPGGPSASGAEAFLRQLAWREFTHHLLHHWPDLPEQPWRPEFARLPWRSDAAGLAAWQQGRTGYPIVDAGMRELWATGWIHNRVRMIVASFLAKDLLIRWQDGEAWFWETLVDADLAQNAVNWQWVAGTGVDAAPYFRVFNPVSQGEKFDPSGSYVRRWVPEIARLPGRFIHRPWQAPADAIAAAGLSLGETYPLPLVDHDLARRRALAAWQEIRNEGGG
jgi:deoxyribodipyrimidine photo-lyase